jgi:Zn-dependent protease with chaperone function
VLVDLTTMARTDRMGSSRRIDGHAVAAVLPVIALLPAWSASVAAFWWVTDRVVDVPYPLFAGAWLLLGVLLFWQPAQRLVLQRIIGARSPTRDERQRLHGAWSVVAQRNHIPQSRFVLAIIDSDDLNAFATGGHLMVVSRWAVDNLTEDELTGVLAHELSHHLGMHTVALTVNQWLTIPIVLFARVGYQLQNIAQAAGDTLERRSPAAAVVGRTLAGMLTIVSWVFLSAITVAQWIGNSVGKGAEFAADTRAVEMGFGKQLLRSLRRVVDSGGGERPVHWRDQLVTAHPPARTRIARIEAQLRRQARDTQR